MTKRISAYPLATAVSGIEQLLGNQGGTTKRITTPLLMAWISDQLSPLAFANVADGVIDGDGNLVFPAALISSVAGRTGAITLSLDDLTDMTAFGKSVGRAANAAALSSLLALGSAAFVSTGTFATATHTHTISEITNAGATGAAILAGTSPAAVRTTLGLNGAALLNVGTVSGTVAAGDDVRFGAGKNTVTTADPTASSDSTQGYAIGSTWFNSATAIASRARDVSPGAAAWVPQSPRIYSGGITGRFIGPTLNVSPGSATMTANQLKAHPIFVPRRMTLSALWLRINTSVASVSGRLGIYTHDESICAPGTLVAESNVDIDMSQAAGYYGATFSANPTLDAGLYWFASAYNGAAIPTTFGALVNGGGLTTLITHHQIQNALFTTGSVSGFHRSAAVTYAAAPTPFFPSTFGTGVYSSTASPIIAGLIA